MFKTYDMALRDYFASQALAGMLAYPSKEEGGSILCFEPNVVAERAYTFADAMLTEREKDYKEECLA